MKTILKRWALPAAWLLHSAAAWAQSCAMCYTSAAAQSEQGIRALNFGILILLVPAASIFFGIFCLVYRSRRYCPQDSDGHDL